MILALPLLGFVVPDVVKVIYIILVISGVGFDLTDFTLRAKACLRRERVPSAGMFVGFFLMVIGLHGLTVFSEPIRFMFEWIRWKWFFIFLGLALVLHLFIHIVLPLPFTMVCNIYYGRKLLDMTPLPDIKRKPADN